MPDHSRDQAFLAGLRRARATPLGSLLPDEETVLALAQRLRLAAARVAEIDELLARPEFDHERARQRQEELRTQGGSPFALSTAGLRLQNIRRLCGMRERFARELDEVGELLAQLTTQAEVVRLAGALDASTADLVRELLARVEGLDQVLDVG